MNTGKGCASCLYNILKNERTLGTPAREMPKVLKRRDVPRDDEKKKQKNVSHVTHHSSQAAETKNLLVCTAKIQKVFVISFILN